MPLLTGSGRVREEGSGRVVAATWKRRSDKFLEEREPHQQERIFAEVGRRQFMRALPGLATSLTAQELNTISQILGDAIERGRKHQRQHVRCGGATE